MSNRENRASDYKNGGKDNSTLRKGRAGQSKELRKNKRLEQTTRRRRLEVDDDAGGDAPTPLGASNAANVGTTIKAGSVTVESLPDIIKGIQAMDPKVATEATQRCRMLLSKERNPPIQDVIEAGLIPQLVKFLGAEGYPKLQFEAAWTLTNIASGASHQTMAVVQGGAVPYFIKLLSSTSEEVAEQSVWALGNIAGDSTDFRDGVLSSNILPPLIKLMTDPSIKQSMRRNGTWTMSNLCRGKDPHPNFAQVRPIVPVMAQLVQSDDLEVMTDAAWALSYLTDGENEKIEAVVQSGVVPRLVQLLNHSDSSVITPALRAVGNIVTGTDTQTQAVLDAGALQAFAKLLGSSKETIRKETCWTISNITAGTKVQIDAVLAANLIPLLIQAVQNGDFRTRKEAAWAISNLTSGGSKQHIEYLVQQGVIKPLSDLLEVTDAKLIKVVLDASGNLLKAGVQPDGSNPVADYFEECGGMEKIEECQSHENEKVYEKALELIETYFGEEDEEEDDMTQGNAFSFGNTAPAIPATGGFSF